MTPSWRRLFLLYIFIPWLGTPDTLYSMYEEKEKSGWVMKGYTPPKNTKNNTKENKMEKTEEEEKEKSPKELRWDPKRQMYYYGNPLPDSKKDDLPKPLSQDKTKIIFEVGSSYNQESKTSNEK